MKTFNCLLLLVVIPASFLVLAGCSGDGEKVPQTGLFAGMPDWVMNEGNTYRDGGAVVYCAMGSARITPNISMTMSTAEAQARRKLASILNTHVRAMFTSFSQEAGNLYDEASLSSVQNNEEVFRQLTEASVNGAVVVE